MVRKPLSRKPALTIAAALLFALPMAIAAPGGTPGAPAGNDNGPSQEAVDIRFNLTGTAIRTDGGPDDSFTFFVNASGEGVRKTPNGNGVQIRADQLDANVVVVDANGDEVENYTATLRFHAQQASHLAQGMDGFRFNMQLTGDRSESVTGNSANPDGRVLAMNAHGTTIGDADDDGAFLVEGRGQTTTQPQGTGNGAAHYNFLLSGTASIQSAE